MLREILPGLTGGLAAAALGIVAIRTQRAAHRTREGWHRLRPGFMMHLALGGSLLFVGIVAWFLASGGSARPDADDQNFYAALLGAAFLAATLWTLWAGYLRTMEWSGNVIRIRSPMGEQRFGFSQIVDVTSNIDGSQVKLHLDNGHVARINCYAHGANELMAAIIADRGWHAATEQADERPHRP